MKTCLINAGRGVVALFAVLLGACAFELENARPADDLARSRQPPGSVYTGWRVFQDRCAACHGAAALGTASAPNLLPLVRDMGPRRFVGLVLLRYDWNLPVASLADRGTREALIDSIMLRQQGALLMPEWQDEPRVHAHIMDLYAYLSARAQGLQGSERPSP